MDGVVSDVQSFKKRASDGVPARAGSRRSDSKGSMHNCYTVTGGLWFPSTGWRYCL